MCSFCTTSTFYVTLNLLEFSPFFQLMGIEIDADYGGTNSSFFVSCLVVEELAKVDPSVSVLCDVQNTLIVTLFRKYGSPQQRAEYLPRLAKDMVSVFNAQ